MFVYKYRGCSKFNRDLKSLVENSFYAPTYDNLNDPCETLVLTDGVENDVDTFASFLRNKGKESAKGVKDALFKFVNSKNGMGIYSLSKNYNDELLWAHYGEGHQGFCIEYNFEILTSEKSFTRFNHLDVQYQSNPPVIRMLDFNSEDDKLLFKKIAGTKSKRWNYEDEIRILTDKSGTHHYYYEALKSIYFGVNISDDHKNRLFKKLAGRSVNFYQMKLEPNSYKLQRDLIDNPFESKASKYLGLFEKEKIEYTIDEISYNTVVKKGVVKITLDKKLKNENSIKALGKDLKYKLFQGAERIFIFLYVSDDMTKSVCWANCHIEKSNYDISINGLSARETDELINVAKSDERKVIGYWLDSYYCRCLYIIFQKGESIFVEQVFKDLSKNEELQISENTSEGLKLQDQNDTHGEYMILNNKRNLLFYSENGLFNQLRELEL